MLIYIIYLIYNWATTKVYGTCIYIYIYSTYRWFLVIHPQQESNQAFEQSSPFFLLVKHVAFPRSLKNWMKFCVDFSAQLHPPLESLGQLTGTAGRVRTDRHLTHSRLIDQVKSSWKKRCRFNNSKLTIQIFLHWHYGKTSLFTLPMFER